MLAEVGTSLLRGEAWHVYLFALADCSAFKAGFSCNPLQRLYSFSHRYFERFDLHQSRLLRLEDEAQARQLEATLKSALAAFRTEPPSWVPVAAGGHTEWFGAVYLEDAAARLSSPDVAPLVSPFELIRDELLRLSSSFEQWAWAAALQIERARAAARRGYGGMIDSGVVLRDWLDAYCYFDIPLFTDDPAALSCVRQMSSRNAALSSQPAA